MQFIKTLLRLFLIIFPLAGLTQTTYLPQGDKGYILLERLEILKKTDSVMNFSKNRPFSRAKWIAPVKSLASLSSDPLKLSRVDRYNIQRYLMNNVEWIDSGMIVPSKKPIARRFYQTPANLYEVHIKDFDLIINPVIQVKIAKESDNEETLYLNSRGLALRGRIANKIGFNAYLTENQEKTPMYVRDWVGARDAVPGAGFYKDFKGTGYDYFDARGYFTFNVTKYIDVAFGYDRHFIGNGHRSLFLADQGNSNLFLKLNTRIWKFNYQNLFMDLHSSFVRGGDNLLPKKFAAIHHLDVAVTKWLNIGLFEAVVFGRKDRFDFGYLNPVIFYRSIEQQNGSFDNSIAGLDAKANIAKRFQVYGQLSLDEFLLSEIRANNGWWANKWGMQLGGKYINAFGISNLDLQVEHNRVRPFTYSHRDSVANYTHYNQPLAHPLGANFSEWIGIARYQPAPRWMVEAKLIRYGQGRDSSARNFGSNIFLPNVTRQGDYGYSLGSGWKTNVTYASLFVSYELRENLFIEFQGIARSEETEVAPLRDASSTIIHFGIRWNMARRELDF